VFGKRGNLDLLVAVDAAAERLGLTAGLALAQARAMHPALAAMPEDQAADARLLDALADWCQRYTPLLAAEQMRAAGDIEQQPVRRVERGERRIANAPIGHGREQLRVGRRVFRHDVKIGMHGARLRQRDGQPQAAPFGDGIERHHGLGIAALAGDDERARIRRPLPRDAVGRQPPQPEADDPLRARYAARHCSTPKSTIPGCPAGCA